MRAASGAMRSAAKRRVVSRIVSAISPSAKSSPKSDMHALPVGAALAEGRRFEQARARAYVRADSINPSSPRKRGSSLPRREPKQRKLDSRFRGNDDER